MVLTGKIEVGNLEVVDGLNIVGVVIEGEGVVLQLDVSGRVHGADKYVLPRRAGRTARCKRKRR